MFVKQFECEIVWLFFFYFYDRKLFFPCNLELVWRSLSLNSNLIHVSSNLEGLTMRSLSLTSKSSFALHSPIHTANVAGHSSKQPNKLLVSFSLFHFINERDLQKNLYHIYWILTMIYARESISLRPAFRLIIILRIFQIGNQKIWFFFNIKINLSDSITKR